MMKHKIVENFFLALQATSLRLLFDILRDVIFLFPRAPSVCESAQTGRGGVLGENLLVTTSYQYALTTLTRVPLVATVRRRGAAAISRSFVRKSHVGHSSTSTQP
ncbi:PREDICTED: uncharacterized protein LOC108747816 isoform X1 [Trachymyrmex septentrionalis]|uniref:uncharacterized protein LOC108747816 isoform X1 n=2 Tax=Trachymyrmex septentrionalis TaxID=34720 RepID=UPI00084F3B71|nr:PREDICTED: uncharacterized protein LOC108747816 isoform X1 [Trachymyrmex septentrionalis]